MNATRNKHTIVQRLFAVVLLSVSVAYAAFAVDVSTVAELVAALEGASTDDEIVIAANAEPYDLSAASMSRAGHLIANKRITLCGATGDPRDVVLQASGNRILYLNAAGCTISGITFKGGDCTGNTDSSSSPLENRRGGAICFGGTTKDPASISSCVFTGNRASSGGAVSSYYVANLDYERWAGQFFDCVFTNNVAVGGQGGAAYNIGLAHGCTFIDNHVEGTPANEYQGYLQSGQAVFQAHWLDDCDFIANGSSSQYYGAVYNYGTVATTNQTVSNCRFVRNTSKSRGAAIGVYDSYATGKGMLVTGCTFATNSVVASDGRDGAIYNLTNVWDSTFIGNAAYVAGAAEKSTLSRCKFIGNKTNPRNGYGGALINCVAYDCVFTENESLYGAVAGAGTALVRCSIYGNLCSGQNDQVTYNCSFDSCRVRNQSGVLFAQTSYVTNTLVTECDAAYLVGQNPSKTATIVNCTIVSNNFTSFTTGYNNTGDAHVLNTLFFGNTTDGGTNYDIGPNAIKSLKSISNSVFSVSSASYVPADALDTGAGNVHYTPGSFNPGFVGASVSPDDPYALTLRSPCVKNYHGQVQDWMATATDIRGEGFPRLRDGNVDIGCYQCWLRPLGMSIVIK